jgi:hypothetical protein
MLRFLRNGSSILVFGRGTTPLFNQLFYRGFLLSSATRHSSNNVCAFVFVTPIFYLKICSIDTDLAIKKAVDSALSLLQEIGATSIIPFRNFSLISSIEMTYKPCSNIIKPVRLALPQANLTHPVTTPISRSCALGLLSVCYAVNNVFLTRGQYVFSKASSFSVEAYHDNFVIFIMSFFFESYCLRILFGQTMECEVKTWRTHVEPTSITGMCRALKKF